MCASCSTGLLSTAENFSGASTQGAAKDSLKTAFITCERSERRTCGRHLASKTRAYLDRRPYEVGFRCISTKGFSRPNWQPTSNWAFAENERQFSRLCSAGWKRYTENRLHSLQSWFKRPEVQCPAVESSPSSRKMLGRRRAFAAATARQHFACYDMRAVACSTQQLVDTGKKGERWPPRTKPWS